MNLFFWEGLRPEDPHSIGKSLYQSTSLSVRVCLFVCSLTPPKRQPQRAEISRDDSPWDWEGFRLKNI